MSTPAATPAVPKFQLTYQIAEGAGSQPLRIEATSVIGGTATMKQLVTVVHAETWNPDLLTVTPL
jgi:hypothetical protein